MSTRGAGGAAPAAAPGRRSRLGLVGLYAADLVSILGTRMSTLAVPWFVLVTTGSAGLTGLVAFAELAPLVVVQGLGGPYVDRVGACRVSVLTDLVAAAAMGAIPLVHATGHLGLVPLCLLVAVVGAARGAGDTARYVLVPGLAELAGTPVERATGIYDGVSRTAGMLGAPLAGLLIVVASAPAVLALDAATFAVSAVIVGLLVPVAAQPPPARPGDAAGPAAAGYVAQLREGYAHLRADRLLLGIAAMVLVTNLLDQAFSSVLAPVWSNDVTGSPVALGLMAAAMGVGALAGNAGIGALGARVPRFRTYAWGFLLAGSPRFFLLAVATTVSPVLAISFLAGLGAGGLNPTLSAVEFRRVPRHLQARVLGALGAAAWAGMPVGALFGGFLVQHTGFRTTTLACGAVYLVTTLAPFVFPVWREMDLPGPVTPEHAPVPAG